ncbi:unnamed protein product [Nyctereutes procyonoides]|uniref:(raccoon dog) hypothetical protein n=1 Tax=Nyctereutes procyonoides TaxID=34880 RepID=A0A811YSI6_NYCPR|nr:unnamed protein product [Nyctereutes procyonoides]
MLLAFPNNQYVLVVSVLVGAQRTARPNQRPRLGRGRGWASAFPPPSLPPWPAERRGLGQAPPPGLARRLLGGALLAVASVAGGGRAGAGPEGGRRWRGGGAGENGGEAGAGWAPSTSAEAVGEADGAQPSRCEEHPEPGAHAAALPALLLPALPHAARAHAGLGRDPAARPRPGSPAAKVGARGGEGSLRSPRSGPPSGGRRRAPWCGATRCHVAAAGGARRGRGEEEGPRRRRRQGGPARGAAGRAPREQLPRAPRTWRRRLRILLRGWRSAPRTLENLGWSGLRCVARGCLARGIRLTALPSASPGALSRWSHSMSSLQPRVCRETQHK